MLSASYLSVLLIAGLVGPAAAGQFLESFELSDVQLHSATFQHQAASSNLDYLLQLEPGDPNF